MNADKPCPVACLAFLPSIVRVAKEHGYALAVHGSLARDYDLIAVPWVDEAARPEVLVDAIRVASGGHFAEHDYPATKPHGRRAWAVHLGGGQYLDLSVMGPAGTMFPEADVDALLAARDQRETALAAELAALRERLEERGESAAMACENPCGDCAACHYADEKMGGAA